MGVQNPGVYASRYTNCNRKEWEPIEIEFPGGAHMADLLTHSRLTLRIISIVFTLIYFCNYQTAQLQTVFT